MDGWIIYHCTVLDRGRSTKLTCRQSARSPILHVFPLRSSGKATLMMATSANNSGSVCGVPVAKADNAKLFMGETWIEEHSNHPHEITRYQNISFFVFTVP